MAFSLVNTATTVGVGLVLPATSLTAGNLILVQIRTTGTATGVTDTAGNTYVNAYAAIALPTIPGGTRLTIWYATNCLGNGSNVVTAAVAGGGFGRVMSSQWTTPATYSRSAVWPAKFYVTTSGLRWFGEMTIPNGLAVLCCSDDVGGNTWTPTTGWTTAITSADKVQTQVYRIETASTAITSSISNTGTNTDGVTGTIVFSEPVASGGSGGSFTFLG